MDKKQNKIVKNAFMVLFTLVLLIVATQNTQAYLGTGKNITLNHGDGVNLNTGNIVLNGNDCTGIGVFNYLSGGIWYLFNSNDACLSPPILAWYYDDNNGHCTDYSNTSNPYYIGNNTVEAYGDSFCIYDLNQGGNHSYLVTNYTENSNNNVTIEYYEYFNTSAPTPICDETFSQSPCIVGSSPLYPYPNTYTNKDVYFKDDSTTIIMTNGSEINFDSCNFTFYANSTNDAVNIQNNENSTFTNIIYNVSTSVLGVNIFYVGEYSIDIITNNDVTTTIRFGNSSNNYLTYLGQDNIKGLFSNDVINMDSKTSFYFNCSLNNNICSTDYKVYFYELLSVGLNATNLTYLYVDDVLQTENVDYEVELRDEVSGRIRLEIFNQENGTYRLSDTPPYTPPNPPNLSINISEPCDNFYTLGEESNTNIFFNYTNTSTKSDFKIWYTNLLQTYLVGETQELNYSYFVNKTSQLKGDYYTIVESRINSSYALNTTSDCTFNICVNDYVGEQGICFPNSTIKTTFTDNNNCSVEYDKPNDFIEYCTPPSDKIKPELLIAFILIGGLILLGVSTRRSVLLFLSGILLLLVSLVMIHPTYNEPMLLIIGILSSVALFIGGFFTSNEEK